jgi:hypothetical protein
MANPYPFKILTDAEKLIIRQAIARKLGLCYDTIKAEAHPHQKLIDMIESGEIKFPCFVRSERSSFWGKEDDIEFKKDSINYIKSRIMEEPRISFFTEAAALVHSIKSCPENYAFQIYTLSVESKGVNDE